jgi:hypothetical protein
MLIESFFAWRRSWRAFCFFEKQRFILKVHTKVILFRTQKRMSGPATTAAAPGVAV